MKQALLAAVLVLAGTLSAAADGVVAQPSGRAGLGSSTGAARAFRSGSAKGAGEARWPSPPDAERGVALRQDEALAQLYVERHRAELLEGTEPSEQELRAIYQRRQAEFVTAPTFTAHHLLVYRRGNPAFPRKGLPAVEARARAGEAQRRLLAGESWLSVARELSDDTGTRQHEGLIRDSAWGFLPRSVEAALRVVEVGVPSEVLESEFGFHLVQVERRSLDTAPLAFEQVRGRLREELTRERQAQVGRRFLARLREQMKLTFTEAGRSPAHLGAGPAFAPETVLASVGARTISEADFLAFVGYSVPSSQRQLAFARPHARQTLLESYLDVVVLAELARRAGLQTPVDSSQAG